MKRGVGLLIAVLMAITGTVLASPRQSLDPGVPTPPPTVSPSAAPTITSSPSPTGTTSVSLSPSSTRIRVGKTLRLAGEVQQTGCNGSITIELTRKVLGSNRVESMTDDLELIGPGSFEFSFPVDFSAVYTATVVPTSACAGSTSGPRKVLVRALIRSGGIEGCPLSPRITGGVLPKYPGTKVMLRNAKGRAVDRDRLNDSSLFQLRPPRCGGRYMIEWPSQSAANTKGWKVVS